MAFEGETVNALDEPFPTLPLWRRVDRQFWWNEALSRPFIDAGVRDIFISLPSVMWLIENAAASLRASYNARLLPDIPFLDTP
jgi:hypothetical protein